MPYNITRSNGTTQTIPDGSIDTSKYSVGVLGRNALGYGATTAESLVRHLENFAHTSSPIQPIPGQLWYDTATGFMKYNTATVDNDNTWTRLVFADAAGNIGAEGDPWETVFSNQLGSTNDKINTIYADSIGTVADPTGIIHASSILTDGVGTLSDPVNIIYADIIGASGNPVNEIYVDSPTNLLHATNRGYVDSTTVASAGDTMTGLLTLSGDPTTNLHAATKQYVDNNTVASAGDTMTGFLTLNADPTNTLHAATKQYVDSVAAGLDVKDSCRAATTGNITLSGLQTIDGVSLGAGDRVLVKDQSNPIDNGLYNAASGAWTRTTDADGTPSNEVSSGMYTFITNGTDNAATGWILTTPDPISVGSTPLNFTQGSAATDYIGGAGIDISGNIISVDSTVVVTSGNQTIAGEKTFSNTINASNGSLANLSYEFSSNAGCGFYYTGSGISFVDDGAAFMTHNGATDILFITDDLVINNGISTEVKIDCDAAGEAVLSVCSNDTTQQGSGRVFVGQNNNFGGGIMYNGDGTPSYGDILTDTVSLFRVQSGIPTWTAYNVAFSNNWVFRGNVEAASFSVAGGGSFVDTTSNQSIGGVKTFTQATRFSNGDPSTPGIAFASAPDYGLYYTTNNLNITAGGDRMLSFNPTLGFPDAGFITAHRDFSVGDDNYVYFCDDLRNDGGYIASSKHATQTSDYGLSFEIPATSNATSNGSVNMELINNGTSGTFYLRNHHPNVQPFFDSGAMTSTGLIMRQETQTIPNTSANPATMAARRDHRMYLKSSSPSENYWVEEQFYLRNGSTASELIYTLRPTYAEFEVEVIAPEFRPGFGSATDPSIEFGTDCGFYFVDSVDNIGLSINGTAINLTGPTSSTYTVQVTAPSFNTASAKKYKTETEVFENALEKIKDVEVITYKRIVGEDQPADDKRYLGVTAESLAEVVPELVHFVDGEADSVNYAQGFALATAAIQEQEARLENADLAEYYMADKKYEAGTVMIIGGNAEVTECHHDKSMDVFGVISSNSALSINQAMARDKHAVEIALAGRVPVKVVGKVKKGQRLVSADIPGVAMAISNEDLLSLSTLVIIGRALEDKDTDDVGLVTSAIGHK